MAYTLSREEGSSARCGGPSTVALYTSPGNINRVTVPRVLLTPTPNRKPPTRQRYPLVRVCCFLGGRGSRSPWDNSKWLHLILRNTMVLTRLGSGVHFLFWNGQYNFAVDGEDETPSVTYSGLSYHIIDEIFYKIIPLKPPFLDTSGGPWEGWLEITRSREELESHRSSCEVCQIPI